MPRNIRTLFTDLLALTFGFAVASLSITVLSAARSSGGPLGSAAPTASVLSPSQGQIVTGTVVVAATANLDTDTLQFQLNGANLGPAISSGMCSVNWNTTAVNDGTYTLTVLAFDGGGNMSPSSPVAVTVANNAPVFTPPPTAPPPNTAPTVPAPPPVAPPPVTPSPKLPPGGGGSSPTNPAPFPFPTPTPTPTPTPAPTPSPTLPAPAPAPAPAPPPTKTSGIAGIAEDPTLGVLANVPVVLQRSGATVAISLTDSQGRFSFSGLPSGRYKVWAMYGLAKILVLDVTI